MSALRKLARANPPMYLDNRSADGHILVCTGGGTEHSFLRRRLGLSDRMSHLRSNSSVRRLGRRVLQALFA
jgi:hypothetical protein